MSKIVVIVGNPQRDSYSEALGKAYLRGAKSGGHQPKLFILADMTFDAILRGGYRQLQPLEPDLLTAHEALMACDHMVFIFPLWAGDMPALMKGFIERVLQPELLKVQAAHGEGWKFFKGKSAHVIMTMDMPGWLYHWCFGRHALKLLKRNILQFTGVRPVRSTIFGMVETVGDDKRKQWLREVEAMGHQAQ
jgi:NAD(P)H dehydrogenase (quinone)